MAGQDEELGTPRQDGCIPVFISSLVEVDCGYRKIPNMLVMTTAVVSSAAKAATEG